MGLKKAADHASIDLGVPIQEFSTVPPFYLPERNPHFRGRKEDLARLREALNGSRTIGITQQVALCASGGIGKSSVALEFAWSCVAANPSIYTGGVYWCDCRSRDISSLADGLASISTLLGLYASDINDPMPVARRVRDKLANGPPSLLILDNVNDAEQWKDPNWNGLLPGGNCRRLLTTRSETVGDQRVPMFTLTSLSEDDARELLYSYREDVQLHVRGDSVSNVIEWFGGLAIGLTGVGIYLGIHSKVTWDDYWRSLKEKKLDTVRETEDLAAPADYTNRVDAVIDDIFRSLSPSERRTLFYVSLLPGEDVSDRWLRELLEDDLGAGRISGKVPPGYTSLPEAVITRLVQRGILLRSIETPTRKTTSVHQVVRERIRELLRLEGEVSHELSAYVRQLATRVYHRSRQWTRAISECTDLSEAQRLLDSMMKAECDPDVYTFTALLSKAGTMGEANAIFAQMKASGNEPTLFTFNTLLTKSETYDDAKGVIDRMRAASEKPDEFSLNTLLWKAVDFANASEAAEQMKDEGFELNARVYNRLLALAPTFEAIMMTIEQMRIKGYSPNSFFFRKLMWLSKTFEQAEEAANQIEAQGLHVEDAQFRVWLSKAKTEEQIDFVVARGEEAGINMGLRVLQRRLKFAASFGEAKVIFSQLLELGEMPNFSMFRSLLLYITNSDDIQFVAEQMLAARVEPREDKLMNMLMATRSAEDAGIVVDKLRAFGVRIWGDDLSFLMNGEVSYQSAMDVIVEVQSKRKKVNEKHLAWLFSHQMGLPALNEVLSWFYGLPFHPSVALDSLIASLRAVGRESDAISIALQHPYLAGSQQLMREFPEQAKVFFQTAKKRNKAHPSADYALGMLALETSRPRDAKIHFEDAIRSAKHPKAIEEIQSKLNALG